MADKLEVVITATDHASGVIKGITGEMDGLGNLLSGAFSVAAAVGAAAIGAVGVGLHTMISEALEAEDGQAQLQARLRSTQGIAGVTAVMVNDLASKYQDLTRFSDDAVISGENMLLTFTRIGKDVFPQATETILDMSTALGMNLEQSAIMLGKALNDPIQGVTALRRVGVQLTDAQEALVKQFIDTNNIAGAQKVILEELATEIGGSAVAAGTTAAGQWEIFKNKLLDVAEAIGTALLPVVHDILAGLMPIVDFIQGTLVPALVGMIENGTLGEGIANMLISIAPPELKDAIRQIITAIMELGKAWQEVWPQIKPTIDALIQDVGSVMMTVLKGALETIATSIKTMAAAWRTFGPAIVAILDVIIRAMTLWGGTFAVIQQTISKALNAILRGDWEGFKKALVSGVEDLGKVLLKAMGDVGADMVDGLVNSLLGGQAQVSDVLRKIVEAAINQMKATLGIASPSKVTAGIGENLMQGFSVGINNKADQPAQSLAAATGGLFSGITPTASGRSLTINGNVSVEYQGNTMTFEEIVDAIYTQTQLSGA